MGNVGWKHRSRMTEHYVVMGSKRKSECRWISLDDPAAAAQRVRQALINGVDLALCCAT
jgi:hypothetical protein